MPGGDNQQGGLTSGGSRKRQRGGEGRDPDNEKTSKRRRKTYYAVAITNLYSLDKMIFDRERFFERRVAPYGTKLHASRRGDQCIRLEFPTKQMQIAALKLDGLVLGRKGVHVEEWNENKEALHQNDDKDRSQEGYAKCRRSTFAVVIQNLYPTDHLLAEVEGFFAKRVGSCSRKDLNASRMGDAWKGDIFLEFPRRKLQQAALALDGSAIGAQRIKVREWRGDGDGLPGKRSADKQPRVSQREEVHTVNTRASVAMEACQPPTYATETGEKNKSPSNSAKNDGLRQEKDDDELKSLERQIAVLKPNILWLKKDLANKDTERERVEEVLAAERTQHTSLRLEVEELRKQNTTLKTANGIASDVLQQEKDDNELNALEMQIAVLKQNILFLKQDLAIKAIERENIEEILAAERTTYTLLGLEVEELRKQNAALEAEKRV